MPSRWFQVLCDITKISRGCAFHRTARGSIPIGANLSKKFTSLSSYGIVDLSKKQRTKGERLVNGKNNTPKNDIYQAYIYQRDQWIQGIEKKIALFIG